MKMMHVTIMTKCLNESVDFYQKQAGLHIRMDGRCNQEHPIVFLVDAEGDTCIELVGNPASVYYGGGISIGFRTDDIRREHADKEAAGLRPGPMISPNPHTQFFFIKDPNGVEIQFVQEDE
ncbi:MAG: VOC family protein [Lachnospiraceae bacterium]|nr:VOC family protein [Lachnospiraceae bacterium]